MVQLSFVMRATPLVPVLPSPPPAPFHKNLPSWTEKLSPPTALLFGENSNL